MKNDFCVNEMTVKQLKKIERSKIFKFIIQTIFTILFFPVIVLYDTIKTFYDYMNYKEC